VVGRTKLGTGGRTKPILVVISNRYTQFISTNRDFLGCCFGLGGGLQARSAATQID